MKPLKGHVLIYDSDCPMCCLYSHAFVKSNMLEEEGIEAYDKMPQTLKTQIDSNRARNEIALVDTQRHKTAYGIDSLFKIFTNNFPLFRYLSRFAPFYWFMKRLYLFISYNRRVIAPGKQFEKEGACDPDYNIPWRLAYIAVASLFAAILLNEYANSVVVYTNMNLTIASVWLILSGQLIFQGVFVYFIRRERTLYYAGHLMTIALIGSLLLIPAIVFQKTWTSLPEWVYMTYFVIPVSVMLWQHVQRTKMLELPFFLNGTWVLYQILLLVLFLFIK